MNPGSRPQEPVLFSALSDSLSCSSEGLEISAREERSPSYLSVPQDSLPT